MAETPSPLLVARLARPRVSDPVRLAVVADPHVATRASGTSKLFGHTRDHLEAAVADVGSRSVDAVLSPGDLIKDGEPWNLAAVDAALADLDVPFLAVPGNHDAPKASDEHDAVSMDTFAERYGPGGYPFHETVGGLDVLGLNTAGSEDRLTETHDGHVDAEQREWLEETLADVTDPLVLMHHNLPPVSAQLRSHRDRIATDMAIPPEMADPGPLIETLATGDAPLVLTGHLHVPLTGEIRGVREIAAPTTCSFPQSYLLVDVTPSGTEVRLVPIADRHGLENAHHERVRDSSTARGLASMAATRLASMPLVDEWTADEPDVSPDEGGGDRRSDR